MIKIYIIIFVLISSLFSQSKTTLVDDYLDIHIPKDFSSLNLDDKQNKKIKEILKKHRDKLSSFYSYKKDKERIIREYIQKNRFDKNKYYQVQNEIHQTALHLESNYLEKIFAILNEEQKNRFSLFIKEWKVE